jgi:hypothetical protein
VCHFYMIFIRLRNPLIACRSRLLDGSGVISCRNVSNNRRILPRPGENAAARISDMRTQAVRWLATMFSDTLGAAAGSAAIFRTSGTQWLLSPAPGRGYEVLGRLVSRRPRSALGGALRCLGGWCASATKGTNGAGCLGGVLALALWSRVTTRGANGGGCLGGVLPVRPRPPASALSRPTRDREETTGCFIGSASALSVTSDRAGKDRRPPVRGLRPAGVAGAHPAERRRLFARGFR